MNFDNIKAKMDSENMDETQIPTRIKDLEESKMTIQKIRKSMRNEVILQLTSILFLFVVPRFSFMKMDELAEGIYYILMFIMVLIISIYLVKLIWFLNKTKDLNKTSKDAVITFIYDLKLTLQEYKTAAISASLLLPLPLLALLIGTGHTKKEVFTNLILLNISTPLLIFCIIVYLVVALGIFFLSTEMSNHKYRVHIKALEKTLEDFNT